MFEKINKWRKWLNSYRDNKNLIGLYDKKLRLLFTLLILSSIFYSFSFITADPDLWGHIKFGEEIWNSKSIPRIDVYSYTAYGEEWINHEWFSELFMYATFNIFHSPGLLIVKLCIGILTVLILIRISLNRGVDPIILGIIFVIAVFVMSPGFMTRPQIITFLLTSVFLYVFHMFFERKENLMWILPIITILWVNSHGGFLVGAGLFPVIVCCEIFACLIRKTGCNHLSNLIIWMFITEIAILINPYGYRLIMFLYESLSIPRDISEWGPVTIFDHSYLLFKIMVMLVIISIFIEKKRNRYWEITVIILTILFAFSNKRHTPIFAIMAAPFLSEKLSYVWQKYGLKIKINTYTSYAVLYSFIALIIGSQIFFATEKYIKNRLNIIVDPNIYPVRAINFLKAINAKGNMLLPFEWGEYTIWKLYPNCKVSIDGRFRTVYSQKIIDDHFEALKNKDKWEQIVNKYNPDIVLARRNDISKTMIQNKTDWVYIYSDNISMIFLKNGKNKEETVKRIKDKKSEIKEKKLSIYFP